jgi:hypothetical protein
VGAGGVPKYDYCVTDKLEVDKRLLAALKAKRDDLKQLLNEVASHWGYEDQIYRFYHQSFKVYGIQRSTLTIVAALRGLLPDVPLNAYFERILADGTGKKFTSDANKAWEATTRPLVEAFFHARFFLEMAVKYADEFDEPPQTLASGWAALLSLYNLR